MSKEGEPEDNSVLMPYPNNVQSPETSLIPGAGKGAIPWGCISRSRGNGLNIHEVPSLAASSPINKTLRGRGSLRPPRRPP